MQICPLKNETKAGKRQVNPKRTKKTSLIKKNGN